MNLNYHSCRTSIPRKRRGKHKQTNRDKYFDLCPYVCNDFYKQENSICILISSKASETFRCCPCFPIGPSCAADLVAHDFDLFVENGEGV